MQSIRLFAQPWWVNLLIFVPLLGFYFWRRKRLEITVPALFVSGAFALAFGFVEGSVVVYLRGALGMLPGIGGTVADVARLSSSVYQQAYSIDQFPRSLITVETLREAATMVMLITVAVLAGRRFRERWALFLWLFALWDITYYATLRLITGWPLSLTDLDVLFLIPVPWLAQVWFPVLVSGLTAVAVLTGSLLPPVVLGQRSIATAMGRADTVAVFNRGGEESTS
ncbi:MAG TPA: hypothetical protein VE994_07390 [Terriglobales bacterium]|nr:hypothetical protein [Terriglobales bacterium]